MTVNTINFTEKKYFLIFKALSDSVRLKIIEMLVPGETCACRILENLNITQPTLSYHMKILCESGIVIGRRDGSWIRYTLNYEAIESIRSMLDEILKKENA